MTDAPSQEELQAYVEQLRSAPASDLVVQAWSMLGTGAEVKLGEADARVLIDAMAAIAQSVGARLPDGVGERMQAGVAQLQTAQVQAERERSDPAPASPPPPDAAAPKQAAGTGQQAEQAGSAPQADRATDRLWIPGRDR